MDPKRIKQIILSFQAEANKHSLSIPIEEKDKPKIAAQFAQYSET